MPSVRAYGSPRQQKGVERVRAIQRKPGLLIGFDAQVNNDELGNGVRASVATWNDESGRAFQDPSRFGVLRLVLH